MRSQLAAATTVLAVVLLTGCGSVARPASVRDLQEDLERADLDATGVEVEQSGDVFAGFELAVWIYIDSDSASVAQVEDVLRLAAPYADSFDTVGLSYLQGEPGTGEHSHVSLTGIGRELDLPVDDGTVVDTLYAPPSVLAERYGD